MTSTSGYSLRPIGFVRSQSVRMRLGRPNCLNSRMNTGLPHAPR
jgi:hypothetical protein